MRNPLMAIMSLATLVLPAWQSAWASDDKPPPFNMQSFAVPNEPWTPAIGDFNGDGIPDVATANGTTADDVAVYLGDGCGNFTLVSTIQDNILAFELVSGDWNDDGFDDVAVTNTRSFEHDLHVFLSDGSGSFVAGQVVTCGEGPGDAEVGDLNLDDVEDIIVVGRASDDLTILIGNGDGTFQSTTFAVPDGPADVAIADVDEDGLPDILCAVVDVAEFRILFGDGSGGIREVAAIPIPNIAPDLDTGDLNGDGHIDLALGHFGFEATTWLGAGEGTFTHVGTAPFPNSVRNIRIADENNDGLPDVLVTNNTRLTVLRGDGQGGITHVIDIFVGRLADFDIGDVNLDGRVDIVTTASTYDQWSVLLGTDLGHFGVTSLAALDESSDVAAADFDGDGHMDVVIGARLANFLSVHYGQGNEEFITTMDTEGGGSGHLTTGDFNGDGLADIVTTTPQHVNVVLSNGPGFEPAHRITVGPTPSPIIAGDFDTDGNVDLVVGIDEEIKTLLGDGTGDFVVTHALDRLHTVVWVSAINLNGDGAPDLAAVVNGNIEFFTNDGTGAFLIQQAISFPDLPFRFAVADLDRNGADDIAAPVPDRDELHVFFADGEGGFEPGIILPTGDGPRMCQIGDVDGDLRRDLLVSNDADQSIDVYLNLDGRTFAPRQLYRAFANPEYFRVVDLNDDRVPEIIVTEYRGEPGEGMVLWNLSEPGDATLPYGVSVLTGTLLAGDLSVLESSDDNYLHTRSGFGQTFIDLHHMEMQISAVTNVDNPSSLDLTIESRIDEPSGIAQVRLLNHNTQQYDLVGSHPLGSTDAIHTFEDIDATNYVSAQDEIELRIKHIVFVPFLAFTFESFIDWVEIVVE